MTKNNLYRDLPSELIWKDNVAWFGALQFVIKPHEAGDGYFRLLIYGPTTAGPTIDTAAYGSAGSAKHRADEILWRLGFFPSDFDKDKTY